MFACSYFNRKSQEKEVKNIIPQEWCQHLCANKTLLVHLKELKTVPSSSSRPHNRNSHYNTLVCFMLISTIFIYIPTTQLLDDVDVEC